VAEAGFALVAVLSERLGLEASRGADRHPPFPGRRVATLVHAMVVGANFMTMRTSFARARPPGARASGDAPSTLGTFLRRFSFGHVRQLDKVGEILLSRLVGGSGPGTSR